MRLFIGLCLTALAGWVDAIGFLRLGGFYASFMSGNTTQLGAGVGEGDEHAIVVPILLVAAFLSGSFAGSALALTAGRWSAPAVLALVTGLLGVAFWLFEIEEPLHRSTLAIAIAMGAQNATFQQMGGVRIGATYVTGTLFSAGHDLARAMLGPGPRWRWALHLLVWACLVVGAAAGAAMYHRLPRWSLAVPMLVSLGLTGTALLHVRLARRTSSVGPDGREA
jgi:uncharacterized membrane protein YoaK (UPF0700 family)